MILNTKKSCGGSAALFVVNQHDKLVRLQVIRERIHPSQLLSSKCYFMDCTNFMCFPSKCKGILCALKEKGKFLLGFIVSINDRIKIAICNDASCFFVQPLNTISSYFNETKTIDYQCVFSNEYQIYYLNQLNGHRPFQALCSNRSKNVISKFDGYFNCSPCGPDVFEYRFMRNDLLYKCIMESCHESSSVESPKSKKSRNRTVKNKDHRLFCYKPSQFRIQQKYTNFNFKSEFDFPKDKLAVPFTSYGPEVNGIPTKKLHVCP